MPWPLASDFQTALQNPQFAFRDPYLRSCTIERDPLGQPRAWSGAFAVVYKGTDAAGKPLAIRVFSTESPQRRSRYEQIAAYLSQRRLACLVGFEYREGEIRSLRDGNHYPVVLMDWVDGETLLQWLRTQCRLGEVAGLASAARQWPAVAAELSRESVAHGDLQHANIMVSRQGELKLVDYDGMCVPSLVGEACLEFGTPPYQHPLRQVGSRLSLRVDDFSALLIYVALHALAADPSLWEKHVERAENDKLLFRENDFRCPQDSELRRDLLHCGPDFIGELSERLFAAAAGSIDAVPPLGEVIEQCRVPADTADDRPLPLPISATVSPMDSTETRRRPTKKPAEARPEIPGYEIVAEIGAGTFGKVMLANSESGGGRVAVKLVPTGNSVSGLARSRFLASLDHAAQARHPNILDITERGTIGETLYFVSDYCGGGNLAQRIQAGGGKLRPEELRPIAQQCLDALKHAHLRRLIHGHLTPQNILFADRGGEQVARISDFALATSLERTFSRASVMVADPHAAAFIPRERLTSEHGLTARSDQWSLAAVFYYALTGCYPWEFGDRPPPEVILSQEPMPIRDRDAAIPLSVAGVIDRALRANPAYRYPSVSEMKIACDAAFGHLNT